MNWYSQLFFLASWLCSCPLMYLTWKRLRNPGNYDVFSKRLPDPNWEDYLMKAVLVVYTLYYAFDSFALIVILIKGFEVCNFAFLFHHVVTLSGLPLSLTFPHYPWFCIGPVGFHCYLVMFPYESWLNYGYLFFLLCCCCGLQTKPWCDIAKYRALVYVGYALTVGPIVMLWLFDCKNDMQNTAFFS